MLASSEVTDRLFPWSVPCLRRATIADCLKRWAMRCNPPFRKSGPTRSIGEFLSSSVGG